jgi:hypothetical protein
MAPLAALPRSAPAQGAKYASSPDSKEDGSPAAGGGSRPRKSIKIVTYNGGDSDSDFM